MEDIQLETCRLCLNTERPLHSIDDTQWAYCVITDTRASAAPVGPLVCWECRAVLLKLVRLRQQALEAKNLLEASQNHVAKATGYLISFGEGFSRLTTTTKVYYDAHFLSVECPTQDTKGWGVEDAQAWEGENEKVWAGEDAKVWVEADTKVWSSEDAKPWGSDAKVWVREEAKTWVEDDDASNGNAWGDSAPHVEMIVDDDGFELAPEEIEVETEIEIAAENKAVELKSEQSRIEPQTAVEVVNLGINTKQVEMFIASDADLANYRRMALLNLSVYMFKCESCTVWFKSEEKYLNHNIRFHSKLAGEFTCDICNCRFPYAHALERHRAAHYTMYRCAHAGCGYVSNFSRGVRLHCRRAHPQPLRSSSPDQYKCDHCEKRFTSYAAVLTHRRIHMGGPFECDNCGKIFETRNKILQHLRNYELKFICDVCGKTYARESQLKMHALTHLDPSEHSHECETCGKRFNNKYKLNVHSRIHSDVKPFTCDMCDKTFASRQQFRMHCQEHQSEVDEATASISNPGARSAQRNKIRNAFARAMSDNSPGDFECKVCNKVLKCKRSLQAHFYQQHNVPKKGLMGCDECDRSFRYKSQLRLHKLTHTGEKPFECHVCGAKFFTKSQMRIHTFGHSDERPFKCDVCGMSFKYTANLYTHKFIHTGLKPHQCNICGARFTMKGNLTGHMRTHSDNKPFGCELCGRRFPWRRNLRNHYKTHDKEPQS